MSVASPLIQHAHLAASRSANGGHVTLLQAVVYGTVQGLTGFVPISSTAHLRIVPALVGWSDPGAASTAMIQLGTTVAVVLYLWRQPRQVAVAWIRRLIDKSMRKTVEYRIGRYLVAATIPVSVFGLVFSDQIETGARNPWLISVTMILLALALRAAERRGRRDRDEEDLDAKDAVAVGTAQVLALIPGASRSGTTIAAVLFRARDRRTAARFTFLLSIPAIVLSGLYESRKIGQRGGAGASLTSVALILAFAVGLASIVWLMRWISRHSTFSFIYYRIIVGMGLIILLGAGVISATE